MQRKRIGEFFRREKARLLAYVRKWIDETALMDSEDIVQDVALSVFDRADVSAPIENLSAYFYRALHNRITDSYRRKRKTLSLNQNTAEGKTFLDTLVDDRSTIYSEMEKEAARAALFGAIDELKPELRDVFTATELEGRSYRELEEEWDVPVNTLLSRKHRATQKLKAVLEEFKIAGGV